MTRTFKYAALISAFAFGLSAGVAGAVEPDIDYENLTVEQALQVCAAFKNKDDRLSCFEALASSTADPETAVSAAPPEPNIVPQPVAEAPPEKGPPPDAPALAESVPATENAKPAKADKPQRFSFQRNDPAKTAKRDRKKFEATVYRAWRNALGDLRIAFTNGEIWIQAGRGVNYTPKPGEIIVFKPGLAGGWTLSMDGGRAGIRARELKE